MQLPLHPLLCSPHTSSPGESDQGSHPEEREGGRKREGGEEGVREKGTGREREGGRNKERKRGR